MSWRRRLRGWDIDSQSLQTGTIGAAAFVLSQPTDVREAESVDKGQANSLSFGAPSQPHPAAFRRRPMVELLPEGAASVAT